MNRARGDAGLLFIVGGEMKVGARISYFDCSDLSKLLMKREPSHRLLLTKNLFRQAKLPDLSQYACLVNLLAEPEQNAKILDNLRKLLRTAQGKIVNPPAAVLRSTRDQVARQLAGIPGLIVPATVRLPARKRRLSAQALERAGLVHPIILRQAGTHGGKMVGLFDRIDELVEAVDEDRDHIAIQFVDFRSADGLYRKHRVFCIGPHMILRHRLVSDHWNVHAKDRARFMADRPELVAEERRMFDDPTDAFPPQVRGVLQAIRERTPLDFFGIDFGITADEQVVLFEANAAMCFFPLSLDPKFAYLQRCFVPAQRAFRELLGLPVEQSHSLSAAIS